MANIAPRPSLQKALVMTIIGTEKLVANLDDMSEKMLEAVAFDAIVPSCEEAVVHARELAPEETGYLRSRIGWLDERYITNREAMRPNRPYEGDAVFKLVTNARKVAVTFGTSVRHAIIQEYHTGRHAKGRSFYMLHTYVWMQKRVVKAVAKVIERFITAKGGSMITTSKPTSTRWRK